ncbi:MAG: hypothetical protein HY730_05510 [Candidatus Tectomicrobia bacterium]|uniref:S9 family peptidase n=1 Tax=Tectimicrobiota bacterium TaxID=2528274 RepID=A0A933GL08_UNCTE|nr:hypothetical protein [Candidatus Tectomicrobia bacterium]
MRASRENLGATRLSWSSEERYLLYGNERLSGTGFVEAHILDTRNRTDRTLTTEAIDPVFSPDGRFVAYWIYSGGDCDGNKAPCIGVISLDGNAKKVIIGNARYPAW